MWIFAWLPQSTNHPTNTTSLKPLLDTKAIYTNIQIQQLLKGVPESGKEKRGYRKKLCETTLLLLRFLRADLECYCSVKVHLRNLIFYLASSCVATRPESGWKLQKWTPLKIYCGKLWTVILQCPGHAFTPLYQWYFQGFICCTFHFA